MKKENFWKTVAFISVLSFLILLKSRFQFSQDFSDELMKSIISREFISNLLAVAISGGLSIFILYKQSKHAEKNLEIQIKNQEQQLNQQLELSKTQFENQQNESKMQFKQQLELSREQFNKQQYLDIKKIELNYNLENLENIKRLLNELLSLSEYKIKPLTERVIKQHDYWFNPNDYDFSPRKENWDRDYQYFIDLITRVHAINNELNTYSRIFDGKISDEISSFLKEFFGLDFYEKSISEVWENIERHKSEKSEFNFRDENFDYIVPTMQILNKIFVLTQMVIPEQVDANIVELKSLYSEEKKVTS
ncbi:hypothetical protein AT575_05965 [Streptococcus penaeicida]|uniref:Uncharacterized protein n=1 Tax=Streptococcus penaeicida TaxID=1765960 RepID=A0A2N8LBA9_9STRE|nr:hypothetical protein [Streptococcus penaeicida]PND47453.1 hypothetical protein AT575_05965 [Streptococcus penaeicida]